MPRITPEQYAALLAKRGHREPAPSAGSVEESELHDFALRWCRENNAPCIHARMDKASHVTVGAPDLVVCYFGRVRLIEFKARTGKVSEGQLVWHQMAAWQGVKVHVVRSKGEFLEVMEGLE